VFLFALTLAAAQGAAHSEKQATVPADGAIPAMSPRVTLIALRDQTGADHPLTRSD
jgi:hypothetical protein